jgi:glycosyltransferase involved in cell wall biosynthesis
VLEAVRGGTSRHLADVVTHTPGVAHHVAVPPAGEPRGGAVYDQAAVDRMVADGAVIHLIEMRREPWHPDNVRALHHLRNLVGTLKPDVIHGHSSVGGALARVSGRPVVYTANGVATDAVYRLVERALGRRAERWIAVSESEALSAIELHLARPERVVTIPNGIPVVYQPATMDLRSDLGIPTGAPLIGTVARLVAQKDPVRFVEVAAAIAHRRPDAHFLLIGMGPLQADVDRARAVAGLGSNWHQVPHLDDAANVIDQLDVFVSTSRFEGAPYTPLEAMRAGVPIVLSDVVGNHDVIESGTSGFLCPQGDPQALADAVIRLLSQDDLRAAVVAAAAERFADRFDVVDMGRTLASVYAEVVKAR